MAPEAAKKRLAGYLLDVAMERMKMGNERRNQFESGFLGYSLVQLGLDSLATMAVQNCIMTDLSVSMPIDHLIGEMKVSQLVIQMYDQILFNRLTGSRNDDRSGDGEIETFTL